MPLICFFWSSHEGPSQWQAEERAWQENEKSGSTQRSKPGWKGFRATWSGGNCPRLHPNAIPALRDFPRGKELQAIPEAPTAPAVSLAFPLIGENVGNGTKFQFSPWFQTIWHLCQGGFSSFYPSCSTTNKCLVAGCILVHTCQIKLQN